jgi:hypothetical protein
MLAPVLGVKRLSSRSPLYSPADLTEADPMMPAAAPTLALRPSETVSRPSRPRIA